MAQDPAASKSAELFQVGRRCGEAVRAALYQRKAPQPVEADWIKAVSMGMFAAGFKYYISTSELINLGFEQSAAVISRTIFDLSLQAQFLQQNPDRIEDYLHWADFNRFRLLLRSREHRDADVRALGDVGDNPEMAERYRQLEEHYNENRHRYRQRKDAWHGLSTERLARACGEDADRDYALMHWYYSNFVHANPTGMEDFVKVDAERRRIRLHLDPSPPRHPLMAWYATKGFLFILYYVNEAWELGLDFAVWEQQLVDIMGTK